MSTPRQRAAWRYTVGFLVFMGGVFLIRDAVQFLDYLFNR